MGATKKTFLLNSFFDKSWICVDALERTNGKAIIGNTATASVKNATTVSAQVRAIVPVSDI